MYFLRTLETLVWPLKREISSVFMTVGEADIPCHPQLLCAVTLELRRLTVDRATVDRVTTFGTVIFELASLTGTSGVCS